MFTFPVKTPTVELKQSLSFLFMRQNKYSSMVCTCCRSQTQNQCSVTLTDLPVSLCAARGDVEQEKKPSDQSKRLHV